MFSNATNFEKLLEAVPDALVGMDQEGVIRFVNRQTELLFGYDRDDLIGQTVEMLVPEQLWGIYAAHKEGYFADPRTRSSGLELELAGLHRNAGEFPINVSLSHIDTGDVLLVITAVHDVMKQKKAIETAQLTAAIVRYSENPIIGATREGIVTSWNPAAEKMYGYTSEEMIGTSAAVLTPQGAGSERADILKRVQSGEAIENYESDRVRKDGTVVSVSVTTAPIRDEAGKVVGVSAIHRDVTGHKEAFDAAQRMAAIIESSHDAILGKTLDGIITSWNPAAERMYGYSSQEIIGKPVDIIVPADRDGEIKDILARIRDGESIEHLETIRVRKDGTAIPVSLTVSPIRDKDGAMVGSSTIARDLTAQALALASAPSLEAVEFSGEAIISSTLEGIITSWNPAAEKLYGYPSEEVIGRSGAMLMPRPYEVDDFMTRVRAGEHVEHYRTMRKRKDGTVFPISLTISPIYDSNGTIVGASATPHGISPQEESSSPQSP
jgi:two-component system cell cycle sensor histidine kinase/response regulator CckA